MIKIKFEMMCKSSRYSGKVAGSWHLSQTAKIMKSNTKQEVKCKQFRIVNLLCSCGKSFYSPLWKAGKHKYSDWNYGYPPGRRRESCIATQEMLRSRATKHKA